MSEWVCAWCDVDAREVRGRYDDDGRVIQQWTVCAYCGRTELRLRKLGRQTPVPKSESWDIESACDLPEGTLLDDFARRGANDDENPYE
jgi:hypothetical protein